jgi:DNA modification methylase
MADIWNNDEALNKLIRNRLVLNWESDERFSISMRMMVQGMRSMRLVQPITMFKPSVAKYICMKYSEPGDLVGDYSAGFGGRMLGAVSSNRRYMGTDPMTAKELGRMAAFFGFRNCSILDTGSEEFIGDACSFDLYWSSPPYYNNEIYSTNQTQAYNRGEDYFFNTYWKTTLDNVWIMLKPGKWFGLNLSGQQKMLDMAIDRFGSPVEKIKMTLNRSHFAKKDGSEKYEYIYMFKK